MTPLLQVVLDTNVLVSAALRRGSIPHRVLFKARAESILLASKETLDEFRDVLLRKKFERAVSFSVRSGLVEEYARLCLLVPIPHPIRACRDLRDDKFLEVAVHGRADAIITGDSDLLDLNPFHGIAILTPADYLELK